MPENKDKLTEKELLGKIGGAIAIAKEYWEEMDGMSKEDDARLALNVLRLEQAHTQLKEIVKEHFKKKTVTRAEIENAVGDTDDEYCEGVVELFESKGFEVEK